MKIPKKAKIPIDVVWVLLIGVVFAVSAMARTEGPPEFECDCSIEIVGTPELNVPFEAILTWTPRAEVNLSRDIRDTVYFWRAYEHMRYVGGDTLWVGDLEKDKTYSMKANFEIIDYGYCMVEAKFVSMRTKGIGAIAAGDTDCGIRAEKFCRSNRSRLQNPNKDLHSANESEIKWHYTANGDSIGIQSFSGKKLNFGLPPATANAPDMTPQIKMSKTPEAVCTDTNIINISHAVILDHQTIEISPRMFHKIIFPDNVTNIEIEAGRNLKIWKSGINTVLVDRPKVDCDLLITMADSTYRVPVRLQKLSQNK